MLKPVHNVPAFLLTEPNSKIICFKLKYCIFNSLTLIKSPIMNRILIIAAAVMLLGSCKKEMISDTADQNDIKKYAEMASGALLLKANDGSALQMSATANSNGKRITRPLKSTGSGTISYIPNGCGDGTLQFRSEGTGNSTALGLQKQVTTFCINPATGTVIGSIGGVGTAANGDQLNYSLAGAGIDAATGFMFQVYVFTGGTGRFTDATGNMTLLYTVNTPVNYEYTGKGTITF